MCLPGTEGTRKRTEICTVWPTEAEGTETGGNCSQERAAQGGEAEGEAEGEGEAEEEAEETGGHRAASPFMSLRCTPCGQSLLPLLTTSQTLVWQEEGATEQRSGMVKSFRCFALRGCGGDGEGEGEEEGEEGREEGREGEREEGREEGGEAEEGREEAEREQEEEEEEGLGLEEELQEELEEKLEKGQEERELL